MTHRNYKKNTDTTIPPSPHLPFPPLTDTHTHPLLPPHLSLREEVGG